MRFLSWNIYHGAIGGETPVDRIAAIVGLGLRNKIDVIALQEVPGAILDPRVGFGEPSGISFTRILDSRVNGWKDQYQVVQALSENNPQGPHHSHTADGYVIFFNPDTAGKPEPGSFGYYKPEEFKDLTGATLRPPVTVNLARAKGPTVTLMNWHADVATPQVTTALTVLHVLLGDAKKVKNPTLVLGDFNWAGTVNRLLPDEYHPFPNWDDLSAKCWNWAKEIWVNGIDHILGSMNIDSILGKELSNIKSDAYHYPLAVEAEI